MEIKDYCLTSPPQNLSLSGSPSDRCIPLSILPVLDKQNPLFNSSPEVAEASLSDAPTSFAPDGSDSAELPSSVSESLEGLPFAEDAQNSCRGHPGSECGMLWSLTLLLPMHSVACPYADQCHAVQMKTHHIVRPRQGSPSPLFSIRARIESNLFAMRSTWEFRLLLVVVHRNRESWQCKMDGDCHFCSSSIFV